MPLTGFFRITWTVQLAVGVALFGVSFWVENQVLHNVFAAPVVALTLAVALEFGKAAAIVWHRYLSHAGDTAYPTATRVFSGVFRIGLVTLSVLCSLLYLGVHLDRPNLVQVRAAELAAIDTRLAADLERLDTRQAAEVQGDTARRHAELDAARALHQRQVDALETLLRAEMDRVVGGVFKGPRYQELERRLEAAHAASASALAALAERQRRETADTAARAADLERTRQTLHTDADARRRTVRESRFDHDDRTHNPLVITLIRLANDVFGRTVTAPQFAFALALFLSILVELGIVLAFDTITLAVIPALAAQHREVVLEEALAAAVEGSAVRDAMRHREAMDRVRQGADRVAERAQAHSAAYSRDAAETDWRQAA